MSCGSVLHDSLLSFSMISLSVPGGQPPMTTNVGLQEDVEANVPGVVVLGEGGGGAPTARVARQNY